MTRAEVVDQALDAAVDALTRRARVLQTSDPEVAEGLRVLALRINEKTLEGWAPNEGSRAAEAAAKRDLRERWKAAANG